LESYPTGTASRPREHQLTTEDQLWLIGLDFLESQIAVLNADGRIERCSRAWRTYALSHEPAAQYWNPGALFLDAFASDRYPPWARSSVTAALRAALSTSGAAQSATYRIGIGATVHWYSLSFRSYVVDDRSYVVVSHEDISVARRLETERTQRLARAEMHAIAAHYTDRAVMILDPKGNIEWVNPGFTQLIGYSLQEVVGKSPRFLCGSDTSEATRKLIVERIRAGVGVDVEILHYTKAGAPLWIRSETRPVRDAAGRLEHFVAFEVDITASKLAVEQLSGKHDLLHTIVNSVPQFIVWKDCDLVFRGCNQQYARMAGLDSPGDVVGRRVSQLPLISEHAERYDRIDREIIASGIAALRLRETWRRANGEERIVSMNRLPLRRPDNTISGILSVSEDVTQGERAARKIRDDEERWTLALEVNDVGVWDFDVLTRAVVGSTRWTELLDGDVNWPTKSDSPLPPELVHPDDLMRFRVDWNALLSGELPALESGVRLRIRGAYRYVRLRGRVVKCDAAGHPLRVIGTMVDIHDAMLRQEQAANATKLESIGQLAAGIAHEINTPIQYIGDNVRFLDDAFTGVHKAIDELNALIAAHGEAIPVDEVRATLDRADISYLRAEIPKAIRDAVEGIQRVATIVGAMKEFSHPGRERTPTDINHAIANTITVASNEWKYVARVETDLDGTLPPVPVVPGEFNQVILNLIVNAAHAIDETHDADKNRRGRIHIATRRVDGWAEICIADDGCGMSAQVQQKIFDPFFTTKPVGKGTGQGLAIAHNVIVEKHHGTFAVSSEAGRGTTFTIRIPLGIEDGAEQAA
jgi:two-component system NtrC family sensor kinase